MELFIIGAILVILFIAIVSSIKIVNTGYVYILERLGQFQGVRTRWHFTIPFIDFVKKNFYKTANIRY